MVLAVMLVVPALVPAEDKKDDKALTYAKDVKPIVQDKCVGCHKGAKAKGGLDMTSFESIGKGAKKTKKVLEPGKPEKSQFYLVLTVEGKPHMPPKSAKARPTEEEIATIKKWIEGGAKE
jgi:uncharacterized membrane protein